MSGPQSAQVTSDGNGQYTFSNLASGGNFTVTPSQNSGYLFSPVSRSYANVTANVTGANFSGSPMLPTPTAVWPFSKTVNYTYNNLRCGKVQLTEIERLQP